MCPCLVRHIFLVGLFAGLPAKAQDSIAACGASGFDSPPIVLDAASVLPEGMRQGERFKVVAEVENDGYVNHYRVESDFGTFEAHGTWQLVRTIREVQALAELEKVTRGEAFLGAFGQSVVQPIETALDVVERPIATVAGIPDGVRRFFERSASRLEDLAGKIEDELEAGQERQSEAPNAAAGQGTPSLVARAGDVAEDVWDEVERQAERQLGYRKQRRAWAKRLGVDPYPDNPVLSREIDRVAKAAAAGGLAASRVKLSEAEVLGELGDVHKLVWRKDARDLRIRNDRLLRRKLGASAELREALRENRAQNLARITALVEALLELRGVQGREELLALAAAAKNPAEAELIVRFARGLAAQHGGPRPLARLVPGGALPAAITADGAMLQLGPVDHIAWTAPFARLAEEGSRHLRGLSPGAAFELRLEGTASACARARLEALGWRVVERGF